MRLRAIVPLLALLAVVASGCGGSDTPEASDPAAEDPTAAAPAGTPTDPNSSGDPDSSEAANEIDDEPEPFESPTVSPSNGLTRSTNSGERALLVQRQILANQNPFGILPVEPIPDIPEETPASETDSGNGTADAGTSSTSSGSSSSRTSTDRGGSSAPRPGASDTKADPPAEKPPEKPAEKPPEPPAPPTPPTPPAAEEPEPEEEAGPPLPPLTAQAGASTPDLPFPIVPNVSAIPYVPSEERPVPQVELAPPPPSTELAESIAVLGVVQVGSEVQILIRTPISPTGRYVSVGDTVANGQVLVSRVERLQGGGDPIVILVQNGIEVARSVGDLPSDMGEDMTAQRLEEGMTGSSETLVSGLPLSPVPVPYAP